MGGEKNPFIRRCLPPERNGGAFQAHYVMSRGWTRGEVEKGSKQKKAKKLSTSSLNRAPASSECQTSWLPVLPVGQSASFFVVGLVLAALSQNNNKNAEATFGCVEGTIL